MAILGLVPVDHVQSTAANLTKIVHACSIHMGTCVDRYVTTVTDGAAACRLFARNTGALAVHCSAHRIQLVTWWAKRKYAITKNALKIFKSAAQK